MPDMAIEPVRNSQTGPHRWAPKRSREQAVRHCLPLVPAGNGLQTAISSPFSPAPNSSVSADTVDAVNECPLSWTEVIHGRQLPRGTGGLVEAVGGVRRALCRARERVCCDSCDQVSREAIGLLRTFAAVQEAPRREALCAE